MKKGYGKKKYNLNKNSKAKGRSNIPNRQC